MNSSKLWLYKMLTWWMPESRCYGLKVCLLRWSGAKIGQNVRIYSSANFLGNGELEIGNDVHIGPGVLIYSASPAKVTIGSHIDIGPQVTILTGSHEIDPSGDHIGGKGIAVSVDVGDGSWLGARALILPGVVLPPKTIAAAGATVTRSISAPKSLLAGVPAKIKKEY